MADLPIPVTVYKDQDFYVPSFKILIRSQEKRQVESDVLSVTYTDSLTDVDSCELTVNNWDPEGGSTKSGKAKMGTFKYSDADTFNPWQDIELWMGYYRGGKDERRRMLVGEITTMAPTFPASGASTLRVRALNLFHRFRTQQQTKAFLRKKDSDIARLLVDDIAKDIRKKVPQLTLQTDNDEIQENLKKEITIPSLDMHNEYPIVFLLRRSRSIGYELSLEETALGKERTVTFHYRPTNEVRRPTYILKWGETLISFQPTLQTANQVSQVTVRGWDPQGKSKFEGTATRKDLVNEGVVDPADLAVTETDLAQKLEIMVDHPIQSADEAKQVATKTLRQLAQGLVEAKGKTIGLPDLRAGNKIDVQGLGSRFSGTYLVTSTTHTIGEGGYTTDFSARMEQRLTPQK